MKKNQYKTYSESELQEELENLFRQWDDIRSGNIEGAAVPDGFRLNTIRQAIILIKEQLQICSPVKGQLYISVNDDKFSIEEISHDIVQRDTPPELPISFSCSPSYWKQMAQKKFFKIS